MRKNIGLVTQEPVLFDCSIKENIGYGASTRDVPFCTIIEAAKKANAHNFIMNLPQVKNTFYIYNIDICEIITSYNKIIRVTIQ